MTQKKKTAEELKANYDKFIAIIKKYFTGDRLNKLLFMYSEEELGMNLTISPASGRLLYHNCYDGGYIDHIFNVCKNAIKVKELFALQGGTIDFTDEELMFAALHHDLGKLGTKGNIHYVPNTNKWEIENRMDYYKRNDDIPFMSLTDRTFFTLQHYGISYSENEYFGIKLTDGLYDEDNEKYLKTFNVKNTLRSTIQYILHWADFMSTIVERQEEQKRQSEKTDTFTFNVGKF
jgi:hypothetical protein